MGWFSPSNIGWWIEWPYFTKTRSYWEIQALVCSFPPTFCFSPPSPPLPNFLMCLPVDVCACRQPPVRLLTWEPFYSPSPPLPSHSLPSSSPPHSSCPPSNLPFSSSWMDHLIPPHPHNILDPSFGLTPPTFGHCPFGWVGLNACPDGLGHLPFSEAYNPEEW